MCGIVGCITNSALDERLSLVIAETQHHRGPDGAGRYVDVLPTKKTLTFLHQRLSIIDLSDGRQPMTDSSGEITIVFNGEIFNHAKLRKELISKGYSFFTDHSDTEVLINMYKEHNEGMLRLLNGMFAFVIYDKKRNILFGARDRTGIKPLYYSCRGGNFYFASELKTILEFGLEKSIDFQSISNYLSFQFVPAPRTIFENISKLEAAHYFVYDICSGAFSTKRYWDLTFVPQAKREDEWLCEIRSQLEKSIELWSISDVEVGASLSGGLDSSAIVALFSKKSGKRIKTFSLGFEEERSNLDERHLAKLVSQKYNTEHYELILTEKMFLDDLEKMIYHLDEPYAGGLPSWFVYKMMKGNVKVALTGTGGDELFGNYNKAQIYHAGVLKKLKRLCSIGRNDFVGALKNYYLHPNGFLYHKYFKGFEIDSILIQKDLAMPEKVIENLITSSIESDYRNIVPFVDFKMQLPEEFLHVTDRFSMAHSIEARVPFLDPDIINLIMGIPPDVRMHFDNPKYLLRKAVGELLPEEFLAAPKKGFIVPEAKWIKTVLRDNVEYLLGEEYLLKQGIFNSAVYKNIVVPHMNETRNNHWQIWTLLMFQMWHHRYGLW